ncbi:MAG: hypothetical protein MZV70_06005 [Desulfobacterales bacterium]|nr:hypothetical protein [Desulfobacterales bacterium]
MAAHLGRRRSCGSRSRRGSQDWQKLTGKTLRRPRQPHAGQDRRQPQPGHRRLPDAAQLRPRPRPRSPGFIQGRGRELRLRTRCSSSSGACLEIEAAHRRAGGAARRTCEALEAGHQGAGRRAGRPEDAKRRARA